ncbi:response regulator transcription factor [Luteimonas abyssi]|uniref:response regulator transcription factor n=1 Tax=Luteimonas abyssi TaxID=1247514 RepID=UPI000737CFCC|nr:response regulator transcription factor [Luteimonas abyssi]
MNGLLVDDDTVYLQALARALGRRGLACTTATTPDDALTRARAQPPDFALLDLKLADRSGLELIQPLRALRTDMRILLVTGYASVATAVEAMKRGADDYIPKPVSADLLLQALRGAPASAPVAVPAEPAMIPLRRLEWEHIQQALIETDGNISATARLLGMHRRTLQRKLGKRPGNERGAPDD